MTHLRPLVPAASAHVSSGNANLPWWADTLIAVVALVILLTLVWIVIELVRLVMTRRKADEASVVEDPQPQPEP